MKALSIRAPWWWFILSAGKDIENRDWPTKYRGPVLIHASKWWKLEDVTDDTATAHRIAVDQGRLRRFGWAGTTYEQIRGNGGCIVGRVDIVDCVSESASPWFFGKYGLVLANPVRFGNPLPFKGSLGLFNVPDDVASKLIPWSPQWDSDRLSRPEGEP